MKWVEYVDSGVSAFVAQLLDSVLDSLLLVGDDGLWLGRASVNLEKHVEHFVEVADVLLGEESDARHQDADIGVSDTEHSQSVQLAVFREVSKQIVGDVERQQITVLAVVLHHELGGDHHHAWIAISCTRPAFVWRVRPVHTIMVVKLFLQLGEAVEFFHLEQSVDIPEYGYGRLRVTHMHFSLHLALDPSIPIPITFIPEQTLFGLVRKPFDGVSVVVLYLGWDEPIVFQLVIYASTAVHTIHLDPHAVGHGGVLIVLKHHLSGPNLQLIFLFLEGATKFIGIAVESVGGSSGWEFKLQNLRGAFFQIVLVGTAFDCFSQFDVGHTKEIIVRAVDQFIKWRDWQIPLLAILKG